MEIETALIRAAGQVYATVFVATMQRTNNNLTAMTNATQAMNDFLHEARGQFTTGEKD